MKNIVSYLQNAKSVFFAFLLFFPCFVQAEIPIVAFYGVPYRYSSIERFREFKEAGFDISMFVYNHISADSLIKILDIAKQCNVKILLHTHQMQSQPQKVIPYIKDHPALYGYILKDEPKPEEFNEVQHFYKLVKKYDAKKPCYVNLLPDYGTQSLHELGIKSYKQYLRDASIIDLPFISFDHYPIIRSSIRESWYSNLEDIRKESLRTGKPFWAFVLCTPHADYPLPTIGMLRLQIFSNLVYGARAIQYFTYWTPKSYGSYYFHDGPISLDGKRTKTYEVVKEMNQELRKLLPLFDGAVIESVGHLIEIPNGTQRVSIKPLNVRSLKITGKKGCIVSNFRNGMYRYLAVVNKCFDETITLYLRAKNKKVMMIDKSLQPVPLQKAYKISGGDMMIFRLN